MPILENMLKMSCLRKDNLNLIASGKRCLRKLNKGKTRLFFKCRLVRIMRHLQRVMMGLYGPIIAKTMESGNIRIACLSTPAPASLYLACFYLDWYAN